MSIIRDITLEAQKYLENDDILLFIGSRQSGKTTVLKQLQTHLESKQQKTHFLNLEDPDYLKFLNESPKNLLKIFLFDLTQKTYVFVDEVQYLNDPSNFLKYMYDEYRGRIKLLVSGSSAFYVDRKFKDSLAGRKRIFYVHTLSFREFLRFKGEDELNPAAVVVSESEKENMRVHYREYILYGGYPRVVLASSSEKEALLQDIAYSYIKKDILEAGVRRDDIFYKLLKMLASQIGNLVNAAELAATLGVSKTAIDNYLYILRKSFHIQLITPFYKNIRKELTKMPKVYFLDLGLRNFLVGNFASWDMRDDRGALLENAAFRQLIEGHVDGDIHFWRTIQKHEVDFIVDDLAYEVKANPLQFKPSMYQPFLEAYPNMGLAIVSFDSKEVAIGRFPVCEAWSL